MNYKYSTRTTSTVQQLQVQYKNYKYSTRTSQGQYLDQIKVRPWKAIKSRPLHNGHLHYLCTSSIRPIKMNEILKSLMCNSNDETWHANRISVRKPTPKSATEVGGGFAVRQSPLWMRSCNDTTNYTKCVEFLDCPKATMKSYILKNSSHNFYVLLT